MEIPIITKQGKQTGKNIVLADKVFNITPHDHVVYLCIVNMRNRARQGTAKTKEKWEVSASTRKIQKQKGTGNARKGSRKSNILRGGGRVFGPRVRDYGTKLNKKEKKLACRSALSAKAQKKQIMVVQDFALDKPSTQQYLAILQKLAIEKEKVLVVLPKSDKHIVLSARNVPHNEIVTVDQLNTYNLLKATRVLFFEGACSLVQQKFA